MNLLGAIEPGNQLGKYRFVRELGRGSMGIVYLAEDTGLCREVAVKILNASLSLDPAFRRRFHQEARSVAALSHAHIVRVHAFDTIENLLAIEMELVEGGSLADLMEKKGLTAGEVARVAYQVLEALRCCHDTGLIHRDIKPTNILLDGHGNAKLTDFGLAKILGSHLEASIRSSNSSAFFLGTPRYAPPEAWNAEEATPAWDFYSLGIVMYQAVTGNTPYLASTPLSLVKEMASHGVTPLKQAAPHVSPGFAALVDRMVSACPGDRPGSAQEAIDLLRTVPEFTAPLDVRAPTVVARHNRGGAYAGTIIRRIRKARVKAYQGFLAGVTVAVAVAALVYPWQSLPADTRSTPSGEGAQPAPPTQAERGRASLYDAKALPALLKSGDGEFRVYDVLELDSSVEHPGSWLMQAPRAASGEYRGVAAMPAALWYVTLRTEAGALRANGNWARYEGPAGSVLRMGAIGGTAQWLTPGEVLLATLEFIDEQNNSKWTETVSIYSAKKNPTDTEFLLAMEALPLVQPLLYNELIPRRLEWAKAVDEWLPAVADSRLKVPWVNVEGGFPDGVLDETLWAQLYVDASGPIGTLMGRPRDRRARLLVRGGPAGLHLGILLPEKGREPKGISIALRRQASIPEPDSSWWRVSYYPEEGTVGIHTVAQRIQHWACQWQFASAYREGTWEVEAYIPYDDLDGLGVPQAGERWRLNCAVLDLRDPERPSPIVEWGYPELDAVEHGALLVFSPGANGET